MILKYLRLRNRNDTNAPLPPNGTRDLIVKNDRLSSRNSDGLTTELLAKNGTVVNSIAARWSLVFTGASLNGQRFHIGDVGFEVNATDGVTPSNAGAIGVKAVGTITIGGLPVAGDDITVGSANYSFVDADPEVDEILVGATAADQARLIAAAINGGDGINTANTRATATASGNLVRITAKSYGAAGSNVVLDESVADAGFTVDGAGTLGGTREGVDIEYIPVDVTDYADKAQGTVTLTGVPGAGGNLVVGATTYIFRASAAVAGEITLGATAQQTCANIVAAINGNALNNANASATAALGAGTTVVVTAKVGGLASDDILFTRTATNMTVDGGGTLGGTTAGAAPSSTEMGIAAAAAVNESTSFTATEATGTVTIISVEHGVQAGAAQLFENLDNATITRTVTGTDGTAAEQGASFENGSYHYVCTHASAARKHYEWKGVPIVSKDALGTSVAVGAAVAPPVTHRVVRKTTGGVEALALANGVPGQELTIILVVDGGTLTLTPTTATGFASIEFADVGDVASLLYVDDTRGWVLTGLAGHAAPPVVNP